MASPVVTALEQAMLTGSSPTLHYWAFRHPNPDAPPETYRLTRKAGNGWDELLAASKATKQVLNFYVGSPEDEKAVIEALKWFGIEATIEPGDEAPVLRPAWGDPVPSLRIGGEKPKKKA